MELHLESLTALRVLCGIWFLPHIVGKLRNMDRAAPTFEAVGLRPGRLFVFLTVGLEVLAGIGLVTGILGKFAAALAVAVLGGASYAVVRINGVNWRWQKQGPEYMIFWALACVLSVLG
ncbi:DoxX family protein [Bradyrhizobium manausense]|uniref:DoxX family protein n=1 Tax=Bradyrhizobium manausense TaxID=989370 RepID=UPI001BA5B5C2|nr:DoxX family protein [Bradyrhizobium manausense]MBR0828576.1 DoxX family protein [Bradyrhizobium manausense]